MWSMGNILQMTMCNFIVSLSDSCWQKYESQNQAKYQHKNLANFLA